MKYLKKFKAQRDKIQKQIQSKNTLENLKEFCDNLIADMSDYGITYYIDKDINGHLIYLSKKRRNAHSLDGDFFEIADVFNSIIKFLEYMYAEFNVATFTIGSMYAENFYSIEEFIIWYEKYKPRVTRSMTIKILDS